MLSTVANGLRYRFRNLGAFIRYFSIVKTFAPDRNLILLFHGIDTKGSQRYNLRFTSQADFLFLIRTLKKYYEIGWLDDVSEPSNRPRLAITFDDGYKNWKTHLLPLLERFEIPATLFITTATTAMLWTDQYDIFRSHCSTPIYLHGRKFAKSEGFYRTESGVELNRFLKASAYEAIVEFQKQATIAARVLEGSRIYWELLSADDIKCLSSSRWVRIGSHGVTHASFDHLDDPELAHELRWSKAELSRITGASVTQIAFPSGQYNKRVVDFARAAGYRLLLAEELNFAEITENNNGDIFGRKGIYSIGNKYRQFSHLVDRLLPGVSVPGESHPKSIRSISDANTLE